MYLLTYTPHNAAHSVAGTKPFRVVSENIGSAMNHAQSVSGAPLEWTPGSVTTGTHVNPENGLTYPTIEKDTTGEFWRGATEDGTKSETGYGHFRIEPIEIV